MNKVKFKLENGFYTGVLFKKIIDNSSILSVVDNGPNTDIINFKDGSSAEIKYNSLVDSIYIGRYCVQNKISYTISEVYYDNEFEKFTYEEAIENSKKIVEMLLDYAENYLREKNIEGRVEASLLDDSKDMIKYKYSIIKNDDQKNMTFEMETHMIAKYDSASNEYIYYLSYEGDEADDVICEDFKWEMENVLKK